MRYQVRLTDKAESDVDSVLRWFTTQQANSAGATWLSALMSRLSTLESNPDRCPIADESVDVGVEIRELLFGKRRGKYRLLFRIEGKTVLILRIWHTARDTPTHDDLTGD